MSPEEEVAVFLRGAAECISEESLLELVRLARKEGRPLRIKLGADPSAPDIHLGHTVVLTKLRQLQDLGHEVTFLVGDFTGRIGDPTGKNETRPPLTEADVQRNAQTYKDQIFKVLDPEATRVRLNSEWLAPLTFVDVIQLAGKATVAHMLERQDFGARYAANKPIHLHEFFYSLAQGYDSIAMESDVELGGTDQRFNFVTTRDLQRAYGQRPEVALMMPILNGTDGLQKMSKSLGNYIGIDEPAEDIFGKVMSLSDELMWEYWLLLTARPEEELAELRRQVEAGARKAMEVKKELGEALAARFHGVDAGRAARQHFERTVQKRELPDEMPEHSLGALPANPIPLWTLLAHCFGCSTSEARRMVEQGAVRIDGEPLRDPRGEITLRAGQVVKMGKRRFARLVE